MTGPYGRAIIAQNKKGNMRKLRKEEYTKRIKEIEKRINLCRSAKERADEIIKRHKEGKVHDLEEYVRFDGIVNKKNYETELNDYIARSERLKQQYEQQLKQSSLIPIISVFAIVIILTLLINITTFTGKVVSEPENNILTSNTTVASQPSAIADVHSITASVKDAHGSELDAEIEFIDSKNETAYHEAKKNQVVHLKNGKYKLKVIPRNSIVTSLEFENVEIGSDISQLVNIDIPAEKQGFLELYAIDPTGLNFTRAKVTASTTSGNRLYKCKDWNFAERKCLGNWIYVESMAPGSSYEFYLTPEDPALGTTGSFFDGFESGSFATNQWFNTSVGSTNNQEKWLVSTSTPTTGSFSALSAGTSFTAWLYDNISTAGYRNITISFNPIATGTGTILSASWWNGTTWGLMKNYTAASTAHVFRFNLSGSVDAENKTAPRFRLRFICLVITGSGKLCKLDDVNVTGIVRIFPIVSNVNSSKLTYHSSVINWTTDRPGNSTIRYGPSRSLGTRAVKPENATLHSLSTHGLAGSTRYFYNMTSCYLANCKMNGTFNFTTKAYPHTVSNVILNSSTKASNGTNVNLTLFFTSTTTDGNKIVNITDWRVNGGSIAVLNLPFEPTEGKNATDYSTFGGNGTPINGVKWRQTGGYNGAGAYYFDGKNDYVNVSARSSLRFNTSDNITIMAWVYPNSSNAISGTIVNKGRNANGADNRANYILAQGTSGSPSVLAFYYIGPPGDTTNAYKTNSDVFTLNQWQHVAVTYTFGLNSSIKLYVNGNVVAGSWFVGDGKGVPDTKNRPLWIGAIFPPGGISEVFNGTIDDVRIYRRILSSQQIMALYRNRTDLIVSQETTTGERWQAAVTPNNGVTNGNKALSNNLTITNNRPTAANVTLSSTFGTNKATENLTVQWTSADSDKDRVVNITDWRLNGTSIALLNAWFEPQAKNNATDYSSRNHSIFMKVNSPTYTKTGGYQGTGAWKFPGIGSPNNYIQYNHTVDFNITGNKLTIMGWINLTDVSGNNFLAGKNYPTTQGSGYILFTQGTGAYFDIQTTNGFCRSSKDPTTPALTTGKWYHLTGEYNGTHCRVFLNGIPQNASRITGNVLTPNLPLIIGGYSVGDANSLFNGFIDTVQLYNRTLSDKQILSLYRNGTNRMVSQELRNGQTWRTAVTPNDGITNGITRLSNNITIGSNNAPSVSNVILNSTHRTNLTTDNLTVYWTATDADGDKVINITDWRINGISIANFYASFDTNQSATTLRIVRDYSTFKHNGTLGAGTSSNVPTWTSKGVSGGAYRFDGSNDIINFTAPDAKATKTTTFWMNSTNIAATSVSTYFSTSATDYIVAGTYVSTILASANANNGASKQTTAGAISSNKIYFIAVTKAAGQIHDIYVNGVNKTTAGSNFFNGDTAMGCIGDSCFNGAPPVAPFSGMIDEVKLYNRTLSPQEILLLNKSRTDIIVSQELRAGQIWQAAITPNDEKTDGATKFSNNITVRSTADNAPTAPTLVSPANGTTTLRNLNVTFKWNAATDADGDPLTYALNLTSQLCVNQYFKDIATLNYTTRLQTRDVCGAYNWRVRANDTKIFGVYSGTFNFSIQPFVNITLTANLSDFGTMQVRQKNDTTDENPASFVVESNSNVLVNVTVKALSDLWSRSGLGNNSFRFKVNTTSEPNSFNFTTVSQRTFTPIKSVNKKAVTKLKFKNSNNSAKIELEVTVPDDEPSGQKSSNLVVTGLQAG